MMRSMKRFYLFFFLASLAIAGGISFYASSDPDGLEKVAEDKGFLETAEDSAVSGSPLADYGVQGFDNERLSVGASGVVGVFVTAAIAFTIFYLIKRFRKSSN